jgi:hypothetical protein
MTRIYALVEAADGVGALMPTTLAGAAAPEAAEALVRVRLAFGVAPKSFEASLLRRSAVHGVWSLAGDFDYEVRLVYADQDELVAEVRAIRRLGAEQTDICLLLREVVPGGSTHLERD